MYNASVKGHNIMPVLKYFNSNAEHDLTFIYFKGEKAYFPEKENINFIKFSYSPFRFINFFKTIRRPYDLVWYHGGHSPFIFYLFTKLRNRKSKFIFNVWNEWLVHETQKERINGWLFRSAVQNSDIIHCEWYGTAEVFKSTGWNNNVKVFLKGFDKQYFETGNQFKLKKETKIFVAELPADKTKFFYPKSINRNSRHGLVIDAVEILFKRNVKKFVVYFCKGSDNDPDLMEEYEKLIRRKGINDQIKLMRNSYLLPSDIIYMWQQMDCGLQIAANDQLSTTFLEPQIFKKEIIATDILPFRIFNEKFLVKIPLVSLEASEIANQMGKIINGIRTSKELLELRYQTVKDNFNLLKNLPKTLEYYSAETQ